MTELLKTRFLIADDDTDDAGLFCEALNQVAPRKMSCLKVENGEELFEYLCHEGRPMPDMIFLDINMPVMNGWQCLKKLKDDHTWKDIPTVMYSTSSSRRDIDLAYELGAMLFVTKPEDEVELRGILEVFAKNSEESLMTELKKFSSVKMV
jgi:CheY-like chemotaxis protein